MMNLALSSVKEVLCSVLDSVNFLAHGGDPFVEDRDTVVGKAEKLLISGAVVEDALNGNDGKWVVEGLVLIEPCVGGIALSTDLEGGVNWSEVFDAAHG